MRGVGLVVEGVTDVAAMTKILALRGIAVDHRRVIVTNGKTTFDARISKYNQAARRAPWLAVRDLDEDAGGCAVSLRRQLVPQSEQAAGLSLRIAERALEAWLLADQVAFAEFFGVSRALVPDEPELELDPKATLINLCRRSRSSSVRRGMVAPPATRRPVGPEYTASIAEFASEHWDPGKASVSAPSLNRLLLEIDRLVATKTWS